MQRAHRKIFLRVGPPHPNGDWGTLLNKGLWVEHLSPAAPFIKTHNGVYSTQIGPSFPRVNFFDAFSAPRNAPKILYFRYFVISAAGGTSGIASNKFTLRTSRRLLIIKILLILFAKAIAGTNFAGISGSFFAIAHNRGSIWKLHSQMASPTICAGRSRCL